MKKNQLKNTSAKTQQHNNKVQYQEIKRMRELKRKVFLVIQCCNQNQNKNKKLK